MTEIEYVPEDRRERIDDLMARDQRSRAIELLEVWVTQFAVTPWAMQLLGELHLAAGKQEAAGRAFFWSGMRGDPDHQRCIDRWLKSQRRSPRRIVRSLSQRARLPIASMPGALPQELAALKVTDSIATRENRPGNKLIDSLMVIAFVWLLGVGCIMTFVWIKQAIEWLAN
tara:strand:- start:2510 stop:3022 length:513 start_codon:yes stop_codon:yes gene_type:complete